MASQTAEPFFMRKFIVFLLTFILLSAGKGNAWASETASESSARLVSPVAETTVNDDRINTIQSFLEQYDSPLAPFASDFVKSADKYQLDYRLLVAISGVESTFGKNIPAFSYNGWGWGIYGNYTLRFNSWPDAIETISKGLREGYLGSNPDSNPYVIGPTYAASPAWASHVDYWMQKIEYFRLSKMQPLLSLAL